MSRAAKMGGAPAPQQYTVSDGLRGSITITDDGIEYVRTMNGDPTQAIRVRERRCDLELKDLSPEEAMLAVNAIKAYRTQGDGSPPNYSPSYPEPPLKTPEPAPANGGRFSGLDLL